MTIITKVGVSYDDHMNDDSRKSIAFLTDVTRLSPPPVFEERAWGRGYTDNAFKQGQSALIKNLDN